MLGHRDNSTLEDKAHKLIPVHLSLVCRKAVKQCLALFKFLPWQKKERCTCSLDANYAAKISKEKESFCGVKLGNIFYRLYISFWSFYSLLNFLKVGPDARCFPLLFRASMWRNSAFFNKTFLTSQTEKNPWGQNEMGDLLIRASEL